MLHIVDYLGIADRLSETEFWVLASLAGGRRHGWAVLNEVEHLSEGAVRLRLATLYVALEKLSARGLIEVDGEEEVSGRTRRYHRLSSKGGVALGAAAQRRAASARVALSRLSSTVVARWGEMAHV